MARTAHDRELPRGATLWSAIDEPAASRVECAALARRLRDRALHTVGLLPAGADVAVPAVALRLAHALAEASGSQAGVLDAAGTWPREGVAEAHADAKLVDTGWVLDDVAVLTPGAAAPGGALGLLRVVLAERRTAFAHLVVDLSGLDLLGEHLAAASLVDGVLVVARSARSTTRQVRRLMQELPPDRTLGVLLTGL